MYDAASRSDCPDAAACGRRAARGVARDVTTRRCWTELRQAGCLKARFRVRPDDSGWMDVVTLNTSGGIAGGDRLDSAFDVRAGARATIAAQAAERFYRALPGSDPSHVRTRGSRWQTARAAEWLPQETILFDRCALDRRLEVDLADDAWFLGVEIAGVRPRGDGRGGRAGVAARRASACVAAVGWLLHDAMRLDGEVDAALRRRAIAGGARAMATLVHVAPDANGLDDVRQRCRYVGEGQRWMACWCAYPGRRARCCGAQCLERHAGRARMLAARRCEHCCAVTADCGRIAGAARRRGRLPRGMAMC